MVIRPIVPRSPHQFALFLAPKIWFIKLMLRKSLTEFGLWLVPQKHKHVFHYDKSHVRSKRGLFHENSDNLTASACVDMQCGMDWRKKTRSFLRPTRNLRAKQTECPRKRQAR